jgi:hypothetical protein
MSFFVMVCGDSPTSMHRFASSSQGGLECGIGGSAIGVFSMGVRTRYGALFFLARLCFLPKQNTTKCKQQKRVTKMVFLKLLV